MKRAAVLILTISVFAGLAGCASNQGGTRENSSRGYSGEAYYPPPEPARPEGNPQDLRDPEALTMPQPHPPSPP
jgi:uncharacterized lipoprotein